MAGAMDASGGGYNLRSGMVSEGGGPIDAEGAQQNAVSDTPVRMSRGRKKLSEADKKGRRTGKEGRRDGPAGRTASSMRRLEDLWKEDSTRGKEKDLKAAEKRDESGSSERSSGPREDTEEVANAFAATKNLVRTPVDQRKKQEEKDKAEDERKKQEEKEKAVDEMVEEAVRALVDKTRLSRTLVKQVKNTQEDKAQKNNSGTQKWIEADGWMELVSDEEEGKEGGDQAKLPLRGNEEGLTGGTEKAESDEKGGGKTQEIRVEDSQETIPTEKEETTPSKGTGVGGRSRSPSEEGAGGLMGRIENIMKEWEKRQKWEWEERMADLEQLIRKEMKKLGEGRTRETTGGEQEVLRLRENEARLEEKATRLQRRLLENEIELAEMAEKAEDWKMRAEGWKQRAEVAEQAIGAITRGGGSGRDTNNNSKEGHGDTEGGTEIPRGETQGGKEDPDTCYESSRRVGDPGSRGDTPERDDLGQQDQLWFDAEGRPWLSQEMGNQNTEQEANWDENEKADSQGRPESGGINSNPPPRGLSQDEWDEELDERRARRKNVLVEGLTLLSRTKKEELEAFLQEEMGVTARVGKMIRLGDGGWLVTIEELEQKKEIMRARPRLKERGWGVYLKDDFTVRQIEVQEWLEREAASWNKGGWSTWAAYNSLCVDDTWLEWDEKEGGLRMKKARGPRDGAEPF